MIRPLDFGLLFLDKPTRCTMVLGDILYYIDVFSSLTQLGWDNHLLVIFRAMLVPLLLVKSPFLVEKAIGTGISW